MGGVINYSLTLLQKTDKNHAPFVSIKRRLLAHKNAYNSKISKINTKKVSNSLNILYFLDFMKFLTFNKVSFCFFKNRINSGFLTMMADMVLDLSSSIIMKPKFFNTFIGRYFLFLAYKNPQTIFEFYDIFFYLFQYKSQRSVNSCLLLCVQKTNINILKKLGLLGFQIKLKGKYTQRAGDRRKVYYYRTGEFSVSCPNKKYVVSHQQVSDRSGATGITIIMLYS